MRQLLADIVLLYGDEKRARAVPGAQFARAAAGSGHIMGSLGQVKRRLIMHASRTKRGADFTAHLEQLDLPSWIGNRPSEIEPCSA